MHSSVYSDVNTGQSPGSEFLTWEMHSFRLASVLKLNYGKTRTSVCFYLDRMFPVVTVMIG